MDIKGHGLCSRLHFSQAEQSFMNNYQLMN